MNVALIGNTLNTMGGGERVTANMLIALRELGAKVTLFTWDRLMPNLVDRSFSDSIRLSEKIDDVRPLGLGFRELRKVNSMDGIAATAFRSLRLMRNYDLIINSQGNTIPLFAHIAYVNALGFALLRPELSEVAKQHLGAYISSKKDTMWMMMRYWVYRFLLERSPILLVNSLFTRTCLEQVISAKSTVLYPPVEVKRITELTDSINKQNIVVTISRISWEKGLSIIPAMASSVKMGLFVIIGHTHNADCLNQIRRLIKKYRVKDKVLLMTDCSRNQLLVMLAKAKVYLHTALHEPFGISVVEGMAAGAVPVVHTSGGPLIDILEGKPGLYGYAYKNVEEAAGYIEELLSNESLRTKMAMESKKRALFFDAENFKRNFIALVRLLT